MTLCGIQVRTPNDDLGSNKLRTERYPQSFNYWVPPDKSGGLRCPSHFLLVGPGELWGVTFRVTERGVSRPCQELS